jgi:hypothetical protein
VVTGMAAAFGHVGPPAVTSCAAHSLVLCIAQPYCCTVNGECLTRFTCAHLHSASQCARSEPRAPAPPRSQLGSLVVALPDAVVYIILLKAGLRSRRLCKAALKIYGPLHGLAPRGLAASWQLLTALRRHKDLSALDLSQVAELVTPDVLLALCKALPNLRTLKLPDGTVLTKACIAAATSHLPKLTALHVPYQEGFGLDPLPEWPSTGCLPLKHLTLPAPLVAPCTTALSRLTALSKMAFNCVNWPGPDLSHIADWAERLPALAALQLFSTDMFCGLPEVLRLTQLTALTLTTWGSGETETPCELLQHLGTLTQLRSLNVKLNWGDHEDTTTEPTWLTGLALLTTLCVNFYRSPESGELPALEGVASAVPSLPALSDLYIGNSTTWQHPGLSAAACARIAAAKSSLTLLGLQGLALPGSLFWEVLPLLTGLVRLRLDTIRVTPATTTFNWLTALTALTELAYFEDLWRGHASALRCELLVGLPSLRVLTLCHCAFVDAPYLEQLCASMPQLTSLNLAGNYNMGAGVAALRHLTNLEELGLNGITRADELLRYLKAPGSLRVCYLGEHWNERPRAAATWAILGRQVETVFSVWRRP